jgi:hypothetical protein
MNTDEVSIPTLNTESTLLTAVIEAEEELDIATCDIPNALESKSCEHLTH